MKLWNINDKNVIYLSALVCYLLPGIHDTCKLHVCTSAPIGTKEWQCRTGRAGNFRIFGGKIGPETLSGRGRKTTSAMALVAQSRWAPAALAYYQGRQSGVKITSATSRLWDFLTRDFRVLKFQFIFNLFFGCFCTCFIRKIEARLQNEACRQGFEANFRDEAKKQPVPWHCGTG